MKLLKYIFPFLLLSLLPCINAGAQTVSVHHPQLRFIFEDSLLQNPQYHSALQPIRIPEERLTGQSNGNHANFFLTPVFDASASWNSEDKFSYRLGQGGYLSANFGKRAGFELSAVLYEQKFPGESYAIDSLNLIPRYNRPLSGNGELAVYGSIRGNIWWKANRWLTFTAGNDKHFIGDGSRSLLLSENAAAYPFFQTRLNIWKINYQHQVMFMRDLVEGAGSKRFPKYISQHVLSYNFKNRFNFYVFEAVVWRSQDSLRHRRFDLTYLNPFIFYRPVEFNQGMPDNVLMGLGGKWRIYGRNYLYGQFLLDEFKLKEYIKQEGWWASKYAFQAGFKSYALFGNARSLFYAEFNQCRPFTYAHIRPLQNYGYLQQSLAHPQGSNFREFMSGVKLAGYKNWLFTVESRYLTYGLDETGKNQGSDIYKSQLTVTDKYGNWTGQGIKNTLLSTNISVYRFLVPGWRLAAFVSCTINRHESAKEKTWVPEFQIGINTLLYE